MQSESILGLLLRAHAQIAEQKHGERYVFNDVPTSMDYEMAQGAVESAIASVVLAERSQARFSAKRDAEKALTTSKPDGG